MSSRLSVILFLVLLFIVLIAQNTGEASITFLFWTATMSRIVLLAITFLVGIVVGFLIGRPWRRRKGEFAKVEKTPEEPARSD
ncbi:MAG: LapA family protein [Candidatus Bipolaricaulia bacterium]